MIRRQLLHSGPAAVVDAAEPITPYRAAAKAIGARIGCVIDTHAAEYRAANVGRAVEPA